MNRVVRWGLAAAASLCILAGCRAPSDGTNSAIPTHDCSSWNYRSGEYLAKRPYGPYYTVENDVWNPEQISQTLYSCNFDSFFVEADVHDEGGAVQSYPSSQYTFVNPPAASKFSSLTSDFRLSHPPSGQGLDYEFAYDIWFDGYGGPHHTEVMIWTYTYGQRPAGKELPTPVDIDGHMFGVWVYGGGGYLVIFEAMDNYTAGTTDLLPFFSYVSSHGWLYDGMSTPLWQIDYGVELCATPAVTKFDVTDFTVAFKN